MKLKSGYIDYHEQGSKLALMFTGNNVVKADGELVMGAGNALACKQAHPQAPRKFGGSLRIDPEVHVDFHNMNGVSVGYFRTKNHWKYASTLEIVERSIKDLKQEALDNPDWTIKLPAPAIGYGGLAWEEVEPLLKDLPDNVWVYK